MTNDFPFTDTSDPFGAPLHGVFGRFSTDQSHPISFISTSIPVDQLHLLHTASEAFDVGNLSFDELVQRDIDQERVLGIVQNYLRGAKDRVVFFPPLLASVTINEDGAIKSRYDSIKDIEEEGGKWVSRTWDHNKFQLRYPISSSEQEDKIAFEIEGETVEKYIFPFGCQLRWNTTRTKLVVIDGQHRLSALKKLLELPDGKDMLRGVSIPVCIFFPSEATVGLRPAEDIKVDLRELFVTINNTGKQVSGHFLTLLSDNALSALTVRELAEQWKRDKYKSATRLHQLEWNQRSAQRAFQREHVYSVTTVSILADALQKHVFDNKEAGLTKLLLNLSEVQEDLESVSDEDAPNISTIHEENFSVTQRDILREQASNWIVPALSALFREGRPYKARWNALTKAIDWMEKEVESNTRGAATFKKDVFLQYRRINKLDLPGTREFQDLFEEKVQGLIDQDDGTYFLLVFQHGMVAAWAELASHFTPEGISPVQVASGLASCLNEVAFDSQKRMFDADRSYTQNVLYSGERVILRSTAREQWHNLILASLVNDQARKCFCEGAEIAVREHEEDLTAIGDAAYSEYMDEFYRKVEADFDRNWRDKDFDAQLMRQFEDAYKAKEAGDANEFDALVVKQVQSKYNTARERLDAVLNRKTSPKKT